MGAVAAFAHQTLEPELAGVAEQIGADLAGLEGRCEDALASRVSTIRTCIDRARWRHLARRLWVSRRPRYFLPVRVFSKLFRGLMLAKLLAAHKGGQLQFFNQYSHLAEPKAFARYLARLFPVHFEASKGP
jgi:hypothetical protein